ncbi:YoaK family protein [Flavobacterium psychrotrophum]|uniref:YoaK family protein n=1 Tax=Flavobacterium psychrotrophum TaxID=2294119 RepID=UPI000E315CB7|nr:YoaK family protein [Flavobacterium psychrotrophum]
MEKQSNIWYVTLLLTIIAGYCDTVTFVAADSLFSAHVTGNFIVFAYQIVKGSELHAWIKLLTFPVFIISVIIGGRLGAKAVDRYNLLLWEGLLLILAGAASYVFGYLGIFTEWPMYTVALVVVCAMGLQNAFGKLYAKETHGPTTMMTGNVTQASLDLGSLLKDGLSNADTVLSFKKQLVTISGFLVGCFLGAIAGKFWGLGTVLVPGMALIFCYIKTKRAATL